MLIVEKYAKVRFRFVGFHKWEAAPDKVDYLAFRHRHLFEVELNVQVFSNDREIEYHDLLSKIKIADCELGNQSCEDVAENLIIKTALLFPGRNIRAAVMEDGENGAELFYSAI